jgi:hypothetical protein
MSHLVVDDLSDLAPWRARTPDGQASTAIAIERSGRSRLGGPTMAIRGSAGALGHRIERTLAAVDLGLFADLELWVRSDRLADGSDARPFFLELRLGSAQLAVGAGGNTWHRRIPVAAADTWQPVPLALDDLAPEVRGAVTQIRVTCVDASAPFSVELDAIIAVDAELLSDVDAGLVDRLGGRLELDGVAVPAIVEPAAASTAPFFRIRNYEIRPAEERSPSGGLRTDHTEHGFSIRPPSLAVDLFYAIDAVADERAEAAALLQLAFAELTPRTTLEVAGRPLPVEWVEGPPFELGERPSQPTVHVKVGTSQRARGAREAAVPPFNRIDVEVDARASA